MGMFKRRKNKQILDLTERYRKQQERLDEIRAEQQENAATESSSATQVSGGALSFLGSLAGSSTSTSNETENYMEVNSNQERRRKLAKRLMDITTKLEDISNQIYHLQQRLELVEKKMGVGERFRGSD